MIELFSNVSQEIRDVAQTAWQISTRNKDPIQAAKLLNNFIKCFQQIYTEEEIEFLQFYFNIQMEMMKK